MNAKNKQETEFRSIGTKLPKIHTHKYQYSTKEFLKMESWFSPCLNFANR